MANLNLNKVILGGRLTAKPELKTTTSGLNVCEFNIAVNRKVAKDKPQETDFIKCQAWRERAEFISKYFDKGSSICVAGSIQTRSWDDQNGQKRFATEVVVDEAMFVDSRSTVENAPQSTVTHNPYQVPNLSSKIDMSDISTVETDEGLPF
jgi:single-strand DNA-binding protein